MANTLDNIMPKILARALSTLRKRSIMPRAVNSDYSADAAQKGTTIDVPVPTATSVIDVTPSNTPPSPTDNTPGLVQVNLDQWKQNEPFHLTDKQLVEIDRNRHFVPMQVDSAIEALADFANTKIMADYTGIYGMVGTPGTTPFATTVVAATSARALLFKQLCPGSMRRGVLDFDAEALALGLAPFSDASASTDREVVIEGEIGRKYGIDWFADHAVPFHTSGTSASAQTAATIAVGAKTVAIDTGTGTMVVGDVITFAGDTQQYTVTAAVANVASGTMLFEPALVTAVGDNVAIAVAASHRVNMVFHRDAFAFAMRPLFSQTQGDSMGSKILSMQDPVTGIILRLEVSRQHKQIVWEFDMLFGSKLVRPELAVRIAG